MRFFTALTVLLVALALAAPAQALTKVRAGHLVALDMAPLFVGKESGCFEKNGLDVETVFFNNPGDNNAALAGGDIDFSTNPFTLPFFAANSGVPIRVISSAGGWGVIEVVAQGKHNLHSIADLKKHARSHSEKLKVGTLQGDTLELILTRSFAQNDMKPEEVDMIYFNDLLAMVDAFRAGKIDVLSFIKPYTTDLVVQSGATVLTDNTKVWSAHTPNTVVSVLDKTLQSNPEIVEGYLKGMQCAAKIINDNPKEAIALLSRGTTYYRTPEASLLAAFKSAPEPISFTPDLNAVQSVVDELTSLGYIKPGVKAVDIFRLDIIKRLEKK